MAIHWAGSGTCYYLQHRKYNTIHDSYTVVLYTVEPLNNGHIGDECFVHYSEVVPSSEVLTCTQLLAGAHSLSIVGKLSTLRSVHCSEVPLEGADLQFQGFRSFLFQRRQFHCKQARYIVQ